MKQYAETESGSFTFEGMSIPKDERNRHYRKLQLEISLNEAEIISYVEPEITIGEQITALEATVTPRYFRSAALGDAYAISKMQEIEDKIAALRS